MEYGMSTTVGTKGQVTIEKEIRDALGIKPGWRAFQNLENGHVVIRFRPPRHNRSLAGILADKTSVKALTNEELEAGIEFAWGEVARERVMRMNELERDERA